MRIRNALKIALGKFGLVFKDLLFKAIIFVVFAGIITLVLELSLHPVIEMVQKLAADAFAVFRDLFTGQAVTDVLSADLEQILGYLSAHTGGIVWTAVAIILLVYAFRFFLGVSDCTLLILIDEHLASLSHRPYLGVMFDNLGRIVKYQLIEALSAIVVTAASLAISYGILLGLSAVPLIGIFLTVLVISLIRGFYCTVMSRIMSLMLTEKKSFRESAVKAFGGERGFFFKSFATYVTYNVLSMYLIVTMTVFTLGVGLFIAVPFISVLLACLRQIDHYTVNKKKYFVDYDNISVPKELRENDENLLNDVDI